MRKLDKGIAIVGFVSLLIAVVMLVTTLFVFGFQAKKEGIKTLQKAWEWGVSEVSEYVRMDEPFLG